jgi:UDP-3-O-[3-hydroxymyristoyl] glucosamine N-acyltransferase
MTQEDAVPTRLDEFVARLGGELIGPGATPIARVAPLDSAGPDALSFLAGGRYREALKASRAAAFIVGPADRDVTSRPRIVVDNPYAYFARALGLLHPEPRVVPGVHPAAVIHPEAEVAASAQVGPGAVVGPGARIGPGSLIGPGCIVGDRAEVGVGTRLHARVTVYPDCRVGARCRLHAGVVIGADGFGMAEDAGRWVKIPQVGRALIGDDVEIGANTTVDRGALDDTIIEDGVKMDNLIQIGHNVVIGAHTAIAACAGVAGSTRIGRHCKIGGAAMIHGHIEICDHVVVAGGSMIRRSITTPGVYDGFFPSLPHRDWMKNLAHFNRLHELAERVRELERRIDTTGGK